MMLVSAEKRLRICPSGVTSKNLKTEIKRRTSRRKKKTASRHFTSKETGFTRNHFGFRCFSMLDVEQHDQSCPVPIKRTRRLGLYFLRVFHGFQTTRQARQSLAKHLNPQQLHIQSRSAGSRTDSAPPYGQWRNERTALYDLRTLSGRDGGGGAGVT